MRRSLDWAHGVLRRAGFDVVRSRGLGTVNGRRQALFRAAGIDLVIDVGANRGQYGRLLRAHGYAGRIVSIEPLAAPFAALSAAAARDPQWLAVNVALGNADGEATLTVAANSVSSSFLEMLPLHREAAPTSRSVGAEVVAMRRLDSVGPAWLRGSSLPFLKLDVQGFEAQVLAGAQETLAALAGLQLELQLAPLYAGAPALPAMIQELQTHGFELMGLEPGFTDARTGRLLQVDGLFFRPARFDVPTA